MENILKKLVGFHTTEDDPQAMHQALDYIADFVTNRGMHIERFSANGHESLIASIRPGQKTPTVMLAAHLDVVPGHDELFVLREADDTLYGRGVLDMKFSIAAYLQLIDDLGDRLDEYSFGLMITTDEEQGGIDGTALLLKEGYLPKVCILPDGGDNWQIQILSKGFIYGKLKVFGKPAHGSRTWLGDNAIIKLMAALKEVADLFPSPARMEVSTLNIGQIQGGAALNQVAAEAEAGLDARFISEADKTKFIAAIQELCPKYDAEFTILIDGHAHQTNLDDPVVEPLKRHIETVTGTRITGWSTPASSDARFFAEYNIPCVSVYPIGGGHHGPEEWINKQSFYQFKDILKLYLDDVARSPVSKKTTSDSSITER